MALSDMDREHMLRALALAKQGQGRVSPNPPVGCVLARGADAVGEGFHEAFGGPHAEQRALLQAGQRAQGATAYVTLMPCAHEGKTPPCTRALIEAGVRRVVAALDDPHPESGDGRAVLEAAGVVVETGLLAAEAAYVIRGFLKCLATGRPFVALKYAMTLDGKIASRSGDSRWVSNGLARASVQASRAQHDAVMIGVRTALVDNPRLTVRDAARPQPRRVILDSTCRLSRTARVFQEGAGEIVVVTTDAATDARVEQLEGAGATVLRVPAAQDRVDLSAGLEALAERGVRTVFCEGGATLAGALLEASLVDEIEVYLGNKLIGGAEALSPVAGMGTASMSEARVVTHLEVHRLADNVRVRGRVGPWEWLPSAITESLPAGG